MTRPKVNASMQKTKYMSRVGDMMLKGHSDKSQMASALGINRDTVARYINEIRSDWAKTDGRSFRAKRHLRVKMAELAAQKAIEAFDRSQQSEVEIRTVISYERCGAVGCTDGMVGEGWCVECDGEGRVEVETVTKRVRGQAGDASHLNAFLKAVDLAAKIENLYQDRDNKSRQRIIEGAMGAMAANSWRDASDEVLLRARRWLEGLRNGTRVVDAIVLDEKGER